MWKSEPQNARTLVWALPISLAATLGIDVSYSSSPYLDVSVQEVPLHTLCIGVWIPLSGGFPHSEISGSMDICSSPKLFAAYHVFHRLSVPRHPPCALLRLTSSYACVCVWVLQMISHLAVQCVYIVFDSLPVKITPRMSHFSYLTFNVIYWIIVYAVFKVHSW